MRDWPLRLHSLRRLTVRPRNPPRSVTVPNSSMLGGPFCENSARNEFDTPTFEITAVNRSGRSVIARPTVMPPAEPP